MKSQEAFEKINQTMELASTYDSNHLLGTFVILSAVYTEMCISDLICAEAEKVEAAACNSYATVPELADLDRSVADVLAQICCIETQINRKIEQGRAIRSGD